MTTSESDSKLGEIGQIAIIVKDLERAKGFYRDTLEMKFLFEVPGLAFFDAGGVRLMLGPAEDARFDHPGSIIYYKTSDIGGQHARLVSKGVTVEHEPRFVAPMPTHDLWLAFYVDSEGNHFSLMSEVPRE